jgi:MoxR-like ATPase
VKEYLVPLKLDDKGLARLLAFLAKSFKGGTDVTSPLTKALELMDTNPAFTNADVVLVTDGELQNPPVAPTLISKLKDLEIRSGLEVHGLLVGRNSSIPLDLLCTSLDGTNRVHTFLCKFDPILSLYMQQKATVKGVNSDSDDLDIESFYYTSSLKRTDMALKATSKSSSSIPNRSITGCTTQSRLRRSSSYHSSRSTRLYMSTRSESSLSAVTAELLVDSARVLANEAEDRKFSELYIDSSYTSLTVDGDDVYDSLLRVISILNEGLIERETEVRLLLLAVLSKEHLLLFGAPGTGKSELGRRLSRLTSADSSASSTKTSYFERLLTKFTQPEELFGPLSLKALEDDKYVRKTRGYLPTASVVFLDEIFKSSSSILNSLLTILNERRFSNGVDIEVVPLMTCIGASNEFPESEELDALYDRFLIRKCVDTVSDDKITDLIKLANRSSARRIDKDSDDSALLSDKMLVTIDDRIIEGVFVPLEVIELIKKVRIFIREECDTSVSDRRLLKAIYALKVSAVSNGRKSVSLLDCLLLQHIFWSKADDRVKIEAFLLDNIVSDNRSIRFLLSNTLGALQKDVSNKHVYRSDLSPIIEVILKKLASLKMLREEIKADESRGNRDNGSRVTSFRRHLLLDNETLQICRQKIAGRISSSIKDLQRALVTALTVVQCVNSGPNGEEDFTSLLSESLDLCDSSAAADNGGRDEVDGVSEEEGEFLRDNSGFTAIELAYSSKEAKKKLSTDDYKAWKKAQRVSGTEKEKRGARIYNSNNVNDELE